MEKLEWCSYPTVKKNFEDMYNRLDRIPACDRRTDILPRHSPRNAYTSRGKSRCFRYNACGVLASIMCNGPRSECVVTVTLAGKLAGTQLCGRVARPTRSLVGLSTAVVLPKWKCSSDASGVRGLVPALDLIATLL